MIKYVVDFDGLTQGDFEKKNQRANSLCVRVCICILQLCGFANESLALVFRGGKYRGQQARVKCCVSSLVVCIRERVCVWSPHNDYYGLTPISRTESLHP